MNEWAPVGQRGHFGDRRQIDPETAGIAAIVVRCAKLVLEQRADRRLEPFGDAQRRQDRRPTIRLRRRRHDCFERARLRLEPRESGLRPARGLDRRGFAPLVHRGPALRRFGRVATAFRRRLGFGQRRTSRLYCFGRHDRFRMRCLLAFGLGKTRFETRPPLDDFTMPAFERIALRLRPGDDLGGALQCGLGGGEPRRDPLQSLLGRQARRGAFGVGTGQRMMLFGKPTERRLCLAELRVLALAVAAQLHEPPLGIAARRDRSRQFLFERGTSLGQPLQRRRRLALGTAQRRQRRLGLVARGALGDSLIVRFGHRLLGGAKLAGAGRGFGFGGDPAGVKQQRFLLADLLAEAAIAFGLTRLPFQGSKLRGHWSDDIVEPRQVFVGGRELQLGLAPPRLDPGGAGGLFEQKSAFGRFGLDQRADPPLADDGSGRPADRGIGEQQLHVARPRLAAVDALGGAAAALDAADDLDVLAVVERKGGVARAVVDRQRHLGEVARRAAAGAAKDHVVHLTAAQPAGRVLAHHPAQRFGEVRLAAAVRSDDAGQARPDRHLGRIGEGFETDEAQPVDLHAAFAPSLRLLRQPRQQLVKCLDGWFAGVFGAVDEEGRGCIDVELFSGDEAAVQDLVFERVVG